MKVRRARADSMATDGCLFTFALVVVTHFSCGLVFSQVELLIAAPAELTDEPCSVLAVGMPDNGGLNIRCLPASCRRMRGRANSTPVGSFEGSEKGRVILRD